MKETAFDHDPDPPTPVAATAKRRSFLRVEKAGQPSGRPAEAFPHGRSRLSPARAGAKRRTRRGRRRWIPTTRRRSTRCRTATRWFQPASDRRTWIPYRPAVPFLLVHQLHCPGRQDREPFAVDLSQLHVPACLRQPVQRLSGLLNVHGYDSSRGWRPKSPRGSRAAARRSTCRSGALSTASSSRTGSIHSARLSESAPERSLQRAAVGLSGLPVTSSNIDAASSSSTSASCIKQSMVSAG